MFFMKYKHSLSRDPSIKEPTSRSMQKNGTLKIDHPSQALLKKSTATVRTSPETARPTWLKSQVSRMTNQTQDAEVKARKHLRGIP